MIEREVEVWDKTCWITTSISAVVSEEAKDGPIGTDGSEGHIIVAQGREALFYPCINLCSLQQTEMSWPLARQNMQRVTLENWEVGCLEFICGGVVNAAMGGYGDGVANTWSDNDMWWVGRRFSSEMSSLATASRERVGDWLNKEALIGSKSSRRPITKCINVQRSRHLIKSSMSLEHTSGGSVAKSCSNIVEV